MEPPATRPEPGDISADEFRRAGHQAVEWIAGYLTHLGELPVGVASAPGSFRDRLPARAPEQGEQLSTMLRDFEELVVPGLTHWNHPRFLAYFGITGSAPGILGELLAAAVNVNAMLWRTSPAATELEQVTAAWVRDAVGLPARFVGTINDTASTSTLYALTAAREAVPGLEARTRGVGAAPLRLYASAEAHSSVEKAAIVLGIGQANLVKVPTDGEFRMQVADLEAAVVADLEAGRKPFAVVATVGTTSTTAIDPLPAIAQVCRRHGLWLHVDAAYGGAAAILPERRDVLAGAEAADSIVINPHKWLLTPIDCSLLYCARDDVLRQTFSLSPAYLTDPEPEGVINLSDRGAALGRRFRSLKLWFVLRAFGLEGIRERIRHHLGLAQTLRAWIGADPEYELLAPTPFSTVVFRHRAGDAVNRLIHDGVNESGRAFISHTEVAGQYALRVAIGNVRTTEADVREAWTTVRELAQHACLEVGWPR